MTRRKRARAAVAANPATSTGIVGLIVVGIGKALGWDEQTMESVTLAALAAVPIVRGIAAWWGKHGAAVKSALGIGG